MASIMKRWYLNYFVERAKKKIAKRKKKAAARNQN